MAMPTDTIYGLAANPFDTEAIARVYEAKGRDDGKPLSLMVGGVAQAEQLAGAPLPPLFYRLAEKFWPGPLTLIIPAGAHLPSRLTAGGTTVALRQPLCPIVLALIDAAKVREVMGVEPKQVIDLLALRGDAIDNIPGAPGIGEKGALALVQRFGSVESALEHAAEVERKTYRESLQQNREQILMSKALATIHTDVPLPYELESLARREPDVEACRLLFQEMEFGTLLKSLPGVPQEEGVPASVGSWSMPHTDAVNRQRLADWLGRVPVSHPLAVAVAGGHLALGGAASVVTFTPADAEPLQAALSDGQRCHSRQSSGLVLR